MMGQQRNDLRWRGGPFVKQVSENANRRVQRPHAVSNREPFGFAVDFLEAVPPDCVVDRLSGDAPPDFLVAPAWCLDKPGVRRAIEAEFARRGS